MMIKILGSFKVVPDLDQIPETEWVCDQNHRIDTSYVKKVLSCYDEYGLEMMLNFSEKSEELGIQTQLDAITIGNKICDNYLKTLYALGFDNTTRIKCEESRFESEHVAQILSEYTNHIKDYNIIVLGNRSADEENGKTAFLLAEALRWPCISQAIKVCPVNQKEIEVQYEVDGGYCTSRVVLPCVIAMGDVPCSSLRVPTLKDRMQRGKKEIHLMEMSDFKPWNYEDSEPILIDLERIDQGRSGVLIEGDSAKEKVEKLYHTYLKGRTE